MKLKSYRGVIGNNGRVLERCCTDIKAILKRGASRSESPVIIIFGKTVIYVFDLTS